MCNGRVWRIAVPVSAIVNRLLVTQASVKGKYTNMHITETNISFRTLIIGGLTTILLVFSHVQLNMTHLFRIFTKKPFKKPIPRNHDNVQTGSRNIDF